jgi:hypothetical protein
VADVIDREALRQLAVAAVPEVAGRVFFAAGALPDEQAPFIVMVIETDVRDLDLLPPLTRVALWVYNDPDHRWVSIDHMLGELVAGLDQVKLIGEDGEQYLVTYAGTDVQDDVPDERNLIGREVRFTVESLAYATSETYSPDPVTALAALVRLYFPQVQVDPEAWEPTDVAPGVFWRTIQTTHVGPLGAGRGAWLDHRMAASVVAPTIAGTRAWCRRLVETLSALDEVMMDDAPAFLQPGTQAAYEDTRRVGQVTLTLRAGVLMPIPAGAPPSPGLIEHVLGRTEDGDLMPTVPTEMMQNA